MKNLTLVTVAIAAMTAFGCTHKTTHEQAATTMPVETSAPNMDTVTVSGSVKKFLINPHGDIDGLLLDDKTQVIFSAGHSKHIQEQVFLNDPVEVQGIREVGSVVSATAILNTKTDKEVNMDEVVSNKKPINMKDQKAQGRIEEQLFGPTGNLSGVILSDGSIVHINTDIIEESTVNMNLGQKIKVKGPGTKNKYGKALMADSITN